MPKVPTYDNFTVQPTAFPNVQVAAPEFQNFAPKQVAAEAQGMLTAGTAAARIGADMVNEANLVRVDDATNKATEAAMALQYAKPDKDGNGGGFLSVTGEAALNRSSGKPLADEYREKFQQRVDEIAQGLGNDRQRQIFAIKARDLSTKLYAQATAHETEQFKKYTLSVQEGKIKNAADAIVLDPFNVDGVAKNLDEIRQGVYVTGKLTGMSAQQIEATQREAVSATHLNVVKSLLMPDEKGNTNTEGATAYFAKFKEQFSGVQRAEAAKIVGAADNALVAQKSADKILAELGPKATDADPTGYNQPYDIARMEAKAREMFPNEPARSKAVIDELRSRKAAWDASQAEFVADNVNKVRDLMHLPMAQIEALPAFQALPGEKRAEIRERKKALVEHDVDRAHMLANRAESDLAKKSFAAYLDYTDPNKLAAMPRKQVEALWTTLGRDLTANLVQKWDSLQVKENRITESMDKQQFDALAESFGMKPYETGKSETDKAALGRVHNAVNIALEDEARTKRRSLTREEKDAVMRREMAKSVSVPGMLWGTNEVRLPELTDEQRAKVVVPPDMRSKLIGEMQKRYAQTKDPAFEPTEDNIRTWYLTALRNKK